MKLMLKVHWISYQIYNVNILKKRSNYVRNNVFIQGYTEPQNSDEESQNKVENWLPEDMKVS